MDVHAAEYFNVYSEGSPHGHFHRGIPLHDEPLSQLGQASGLAPNLSRGWYESAKLPTQDRLEFTRDFWLAKLSFHPNLDAFLVKFFASLDDIGIFLTQQKYDDPFGVHQVYSLAENGGFFHAVTN